MATDVESKKTRMVQSVVSPALLKAVQEAARRDDRPVSVWVRRQLEQAVKQQTAAQDNHPSR
jgi:predicted transcriptional regulator